MAPPPTPPRTSPSRTLRDVARVIRSKNAKPLYLTIDVMFDDVDEFELVAGSGVISQQRIAALYRVPAKTVTVIDYPAALAIKVTLERWTPAASTDDRDVLGAQLAAPMFDLEVPAPAKSPAPRPERVRHIRGAASGGDELRALGVTGFGGIPQDSLARGVATRPHFIGCDMGTVDLGPYYLGSGSGGGATDRDLELLLEARESAGVPLLCASAGLAGGTVHLDGVVERVQRIAKRRGWTPRIVTIDTEVSKADVLQAVEEGRVRPLGPLPPLDAAGVNDAVRIVGQIGPEPFIAALEEGADIVLAGRACDTSPFVAAPIRAGLDRGLAYHMAKIIECASICADPGGRDSIVGTLRGDHFTLESQAPGRRCTPMSVAAHSLYEQPNPYLMVEPGGVLDTRDCVYEALDDRVAMVSGSRWVPSDQYTIKLEGARRAGHRFFCIAGVRDAAVVTNVALIEETVREGIAQNYPGQEYSLLYRVYGRDGVLGEREPVAESAAHELCLLIDVVAEERELAREICAQAKQNTMHSGFPGRSSTAGNVAFPFSPEIHDGGEVYEFNVYHVVEVDDPMAFSTLEVVSL